MDSLVGLYMADAEPKITVDNTNVVSNCRFFDLSYPNNSDLTYTQCVTAPQVINNYARGVDALFFIEPGSQSLGNNVFFTGQTCLVSGNTLVNSGMVARIRMHPNGTFAGNLNVTGNSVGMMNNPYAFFGPRGPQGFTIEQDQIGNPRIRELDDSKQYVHLPGFLQRKSYGREGDLYGWVGSILSHGKLVSYK